MSATNRCKQNALGAILTLSVISCGRHPNCGPGTIEQNGQCVAAAPAAPPAPPPDPYTFDHYGVYVRSEGRTSELTSLPRRSLGMAGNVNPGLSGTTGPLVHAHAIEIIVYDPSHCASDRYALVRIERIGRNGDGAPTLDVERVWNRGGFVPAQTTDLHPPTARKAPVPGHSDMCRIVSDYLSGGLYYAAIMEPTDVTQYVFHVGD